MATFFDEAYYLKTKLTQLKSVGEKDANGNDYTLKTLQQAINDAGMTPESHYQQFGRAEHLNPNAYFNESEYLQAKLNQLHSLNEKDENGNDFTVETLVKAIEGLGLSVAEHYEQFGSHETDGKGNLINPSNGFDSNAYVAAKLAELVKAEPEQWAGKTAADVVAAIAEAGMSPVTHYEMHGVTEANAFGVALVQTVPVTLRVENDPARATVTGELVPSNYNAPTPPPSAVTAETAAPVTKPADMGGLANSSVSPAVTVPAKPVPVPGDSDYVAPPANIVDTNDNPVVVVPPTSAGGKPQFGVVTDGGTVIGVDNNGNTTDTVIGKVDGDSGTVTPITPTTPDQPSTPPTPPVQPAEAPTLTGVSFTEGNSDTITLTFNETVKGASKENFTVNSTAVTNAEVSADGQTVTLTVADTAAVNKALVVTYDKDAEGGTPLDNSGAKVADFTVGLVQGSGTTSGKLVLDNTSEVFLNGLMSTDLTPANIPTVTSTADELTVHLSGVGSTLNGLPVASTPYKQPDTTADSPRDFLDQNLTAVLAATLLNDIKPVKIEDAKATSYNLVAEKSGDKDIINMVDVGVGSADGGPDKAETLTISGEGKALVNVDIANLTEINASANKGGVYVNTVALTQAEQILINAQTGKLGSVTGGSGDDMFSLKMEQIGTVTDTNTTANVASARNFKLTSKLDGGGSDDLLSLTVALTDGDHLVLNKNSFSNEQGTLSGFEHIMLDKVGTSNAFKIDAKDFGTSLGINELILRSSATIENFDGLGADKVSVLCPNPGNPNAKPATDNLNLTVSGSTENQTLNLDVIMTNTSAELQGHVILKTTNINAINVTGHDDTSILKFANAANNDMRFNASDYAGKFEYTCSMGKDAITIGANNVSIKDTSTAPTSNLCDKIADLGAGDTIQLATGSYNAVDGTIPTATTMSTTASLDAAIVKVDNQTFLVYETTVGDANTLGTCQAIELTGVTATNYSVSTDGVVSFSETATA